MRFLVHRRSGFGQSSSARTPILQRHTPMDWPFPRGRDFVPRSLQNILKELREDVGVTPSHGAGDLSVWADRGVLLLNTTLTVYEGAAGSHGRWGWERFTAQALRLTRALPQPVAYLLWGGHAQNTAVGAGIPRSGEGVFVSAHPSPLSAGRGFFGSRPFSRVNAFLRERGGEEIDWSL